MGKSIIEALYNGNIRPYERNMPLDFERKELEERIKSEKDDLIQGMTYEKHKSLEALETMYTEAAGDNEVCAFSKGLRLGARIMIEILEGGDDIINE